MKKIFILFTLLLAFTFCKGPGSGPLVKESFKKQEQGQDKSQPVAGQAQTNKEPTA